MEKTDKVIEILRRKGLRNEDLANEDIPMFRRVGELIESNRPLTFILPAFPAKSSASKKTIGINPDFAEVLALKNLNDLCEEIFEFYKNEITIVICSDGRAFGDVVNVSDENIDIYGQGISKIIRDYHLSHLKFFRMDDLYPSLNPHQLRELLISEFAEDFEMIRNKVKTNENYQRLFNGMHRFLLEEADYSTGLSKNQIERDAKNRTYELIRRSEAWTSLIEREFQNSLRLSIHPHSLKHEKFGISLVPSSSKWATPWHNVIVKIKDKFELMHKEQAEKLNAILKLQDGKYAYYEIV